MTIKASYTGDRDIVHQAQSTTSSEWKALPHGDIRKAHIGCDQTKMNVRPPTFRKNPLEAAKSLFSSPLEYISSRKATFR